MLTAKRSIANPLLAVRSACVRELRADDVLLSTGEAAHVAASCLLRPQRGDRVALVEVDNGEIYITAILDRDVAQAAQLEVIGASKVTFAADRFAVTARRSIDLHSLQDVDISAATGRFNVSARHMVIVAIDSIVQSARQSIANMGTYVLQVRELLRMHGQQAVVTAEHDIKMDAERISLG